MKVKYFFMCLFLELGARIDCSAAAEQSEVDVFQAASRGALLRVQELVSQGVPLTVTDQLGKAALHHAAAHGQKHVIQFLLSLAEAQRIRLIDCRDATGRTPLVDAVASGQLNIVCLLIANGANVNRSTDAHYTPLHLAACLPVTELETENVMEDCMRCQVKYFSFAEVVYLLIEAGAEIDLADMQRETPLYHAIINKLHTVVRLLLYAGADVWAVDRHGASRLANALYESGRLVVYELLRFGVPILPDARDELRAQGLDYFVHSQQKQWEVLMKGICEGLHIPQDIGGLITRFVVTQDAIPHNPTLQQGPPAS